MALSKKLVSHGARINAFQTPVRDFVLFSSREVGMLRLHKANLILPISNIGKSLLIGRWTRIHTWPWLTKVFIFLEVISKFWTSTNLERKTQQIKLEEANENMASQIKKSVGNGKTLSKKFKEESPEPDKDSDVDSDDLPEDNLIEKRDNNITSEDDDEFNDKAKKKRRKRDLSEKEKNKATKTDDPAVTEGRVIFLK